MRVSSRSARCSRGSATARRGLVWDTAKEVASLKTLNGTAASGPAAGWPKIETDIDACEAILSLAPETNGEVTLKA